MENHSTSMSASLRCDSEFTEYSEYTRPSHMRSTDTLGYESCDKSSVTSSPRMRSSMSIVSQNEDTAGENEQLDEDKLGPNLGDVASESIKAVALSASMVADAICALTDSCMRDPTKTCVSSGEQNSEQIQDSETKQNDGEDSDHRRRSMPSDTSASGATEDSSLLTTEPPENSNGERRTRKPFGFFRRGAPEGLPGGDSETVVSKRKQKQQRRKSFGKSDQLDPAGKGEVGKNAGKNDAVRKGTATTPIQTNKPKARSNRPMSPMKEKKATRGILRTSASSRAANSGASNRAAKSGNTLSTSSPRSTRRFMRRSKKTKCGEKYSEFNDEPLYQKKSENISINDNIHTIRVGRNRR